MMANPDTLVCFKCGTHLRDLPLPPGRTSQCPQCRADLHVCRMCRFYDTRYTSDCSHQRADKVLDKTRVNFCSHFRVRHRAYDPGGDQAKPEHRAALEALFSTQTGQRPEGGPAMTEAERSEARKASARKSLEDLFGGDE